MVRNTSKKTNDEELDTSGWLTRNEASDILKMSVSTIANYERRGKLHPRYAYRPDSRGIDHHVAIYDPKELMKLPSGGRIHGPREPGEVAARSFELFAQGRGLQDVVIELRETPSRIRELHESWLDMGGADLTITTTAKSVLEKLVGPFSTVADLIAMIETALKREP